MRYFALILISALVIYFLFLKPFFEERGIDFDINGFTFSSDPLGISVENIFLYFRAGNTVLFTNLEDLSLMWKGSPSLFLKEGAMIFINQGPYRKTTRGDKRAKKTKEKTSTKIGNIFIPSFFKNMSIKVDSFTFTFVNENHTTIHLRDLVQKERVLSLSGEILIEGDRYSFKVDGLKYLHDSFRLKNFQLNSAIVDLKVEGKVEEGAIAGEFLFEGVYKGLNAGYIVIPRVAFHGDGTIGEEGISFKMIGEAKDLKVINRFYREVRASAVGLYRFNGDFEVRGKLKSEGVDADFIYGLIPNERLKIYVHRLLLDSQVAYFPFSIIGWAEGIVDLNLEEGHLDIEARSSSMTLEGIHFQMVEAHFSYDLVKGVGNLTAYASGLGDLQVWMYFGSGGVGGYIDMKNMFLSKAGVTAHLSGIGRFSISGDVTFTFEGIGKDIAYREFALGDADLRVKVNDRELNSVVKGAGFVIRADGEIGEFLDIRATFRNFERRLRDVIVGVKNGKIIFKGWTDKFTIMPSLEGVIVKGKGLDLEGSAGGLISRQGTISGKVRLDINRGIYGGRDLSGSFITMRFEGTKTAGIYYLRDLISGNYIVDFMGQALVTNGAIMAGKGSLSYTFYGSPQKGHLSFELSLPIRGKEALLRGRAHYREKDYEAFLEGADLKIGIAKVRFGGLSIKGRGSKALLSFGGLNVSLIDESVLSVKASEGTLDLEKKSFYMDFDIEGSVKGKAKVRFDRDRGLSFLSKGIVDLSRLSMFTFTPLGGRAEGELSFRASYNNGEVVLEAYTGKELKVYSKYFSFPMLGWIELRGIGRNLSAFLTLWKNGEGLSLNLGTSDFRNFYLYVLSKNAPISIKDNAFEGDLRLTSEGWVWVEDRRRARVTLDVILGGEISVRKISGGDRVLSVKTDDIKKPTGPEVNFDVRFTTDKLLRVTLPEGYIFTKVKGWVKGKAQDPDYTVVVEFVSGELNYFGRKFYVRGGTFTMVKEKGKEEKRVNLLIASTYEDLTIFLNLKGDLSDPSLFVWSEPPMSRKEILSKLIIGTSAEGFFPVTEGLFRAFGSVGAIRSGLSENFGVDISFSIQTGSSGDLGFNVNIRKKLGRIFSVEYQQSTLADPRSTYFGGNIKLPGGFQIYGRSFSNDALEVKLKMQGKFDF